MVVCIIIFLTMWTFFSIVYCVYTGKERERKEKRNRGKCFYYIFTSEKKAQEKVFLQKLTTTRPKNSNAIIFLCLRAAFKIINIMYKGLFYLTISTSDRVHWIFDAFCCHVNQNLKVINFVKIKDSKWTLNPQLNFFADIIILEFSTLSVWQTECRILSS